MRVWHRTRGAVAGLVVALCVLTGCNLQTIGAPTGPVSLTATFDDAQGLVVGNNVQINNVVIGSVTHIDLRDYRARVKMSVSGHHKIPSDALATIRQSTLLGEYFVDISFPVDERATSYLHDGDSISRTDTTPPVEAVVNKAGELLNALSANDIAGIVDASAIALKDRGPELHRLIGQLATLANTVTAQAPELGSTIDDLGKLGRTVAPLRNQIGTLLDNVAKTTTMLTADRTKFFTTLDAFNKLLVSTNDNVIAPHAQQLSALIREANTILASLNKSSSIITQAVDNFAMAVPRLAKVVSHGQLLMAEWVDVNLGTIGVQSKFPAVIASVLP